MVLRTLYLTGLAIIAWCLAAEEVLAQEHLLRRLTFSKPVTIRSMVPIGDEVLFRSDNAIGKLDKYGKPIWVHGLDTVGGIDAIVRLTDLAMVGTTIYAAGVVPFANGLSFIIITLRGDGMVQRSRRFRVSASGLGPFLTPTPDGVVFSLINSDPCSCLVMEFSSDLQLHFQPHLLSRPTFNNSTIQSVIYRGTGDSLFMLQSTLPSRSEDPGLLTSLVITHDSLIVLAQHRLSSGSILLRRGLDIPSKGYTYIYGDRTNQLRRGILLLKMSYSGILDTGVTINEPLGFCSESMDCTADGSIVFSGISCENFSVLYCLDSTLTLKQVSSVANINARRQLLCTATSPTGDVLLAGGGDAPDDPSFFHRTNTAFDNCTLAPNLGSVSAEVLSRSDTSAPNYSYETIGFEELSFVLIPVPFTTTTDSILCSSVNNVSPASMTPAPMIFPNPIQRSQTLHIHLPETAVKNDGILTLRSSAGAIIARQELHSASVIALSLPAYTFASGIYFIELQDANSFATLWRGKVVVE